MSRSDKQAKERSCYKNAKPGRNMKRVPVLLFIFLFAMSISQTCSAKTKKVPTGKIEGDTYTDARFGFRVSSIENWKMGVAEERDQRQSLVRVTLHKVNYQIKRDSRFSAYETARPTIVVTADTSSLSAGDFEKLLLAGKSNSQLRINDEYFLKLDMLNNSEFVNSNEVEIDSVKGRRMIVKKTYSKQVGEERSGGGYATDSDKLEVGKGPSKVLMKKGDVVYAIQFSCEREFVKLTNEEFAKIIASWQF